MRYATADNFTGRPLPGYNAANACCAARRPRRSATCKRICRKQRMIPKSGNRFRIGSCPGFILTESLRSPHPRRARDGSLGATNGDDSELTRRFYPSLQKRNLFALGYIASQSRHSTGATVDLTLIKLPAAASERFDPAARYGPCTGPAAKRAPDTGIDMGTAFDCFDVKSYLATARSPPSSGAGATCSTPPCAATALPITSANGGTIHSARPSRAPMILRSGRGGR